jgi:hypothetical protein
MNAPLLRLSARRAAPLPALAVVVGVTLLAVVDPPGRAEIVEVSPTFEEVIRGGRELAARTGWIAGLLVASALVALFAARVPDRWFRHEGDWLGVTGTSRSSIVRTCLAGILLGTAGFPLVIGLVAGPLGGARGEPHGDHAARAPLLELESIAGPSRSFVLMPGERFEQEFPEGTTHADSRVRVRVAPALGGEGPTTLARVEAAGQVSEQLVARRAWLEVSPSPGMRRVSITNIGTGALAVVGPDPVEAWRPSNASGAGHLRLAAHAGLYLVFLAALAFGLGAWMGPGIAATLAISLWLGARMALAATPMEGALPGGASLVAAIQAIAEGRSPQPLSTAPTIAAAGAVLTGFALARSSLGTWRRESRSS